MESKPHCPYCKQKAKLSENSKGGFIYICEPCDAKVGCHPRTKIALGFLADKELRHWRRLAHIWFDTTWKGSDVVTRKQAYWWLSKRLYIAEEDCHIAQFTVRDCKKTVILCCPLLEKYVSL